MDNNFTIFTRMSFTELMNPVERALELNTLYSIQNNLIRHIITDNVDSSSKVVGSNLSISANQCLKCLNFYCNSVLTKADKSGILLFLISIWKTPKNF